MTSFERISPNIDPAVTGDRYLVKTEANELTFEVRPVGPQTKGYILALTQSEPPITDTAFYLSEVYVQNDEVELGERFELVSLFPILLKTAFKAMEITEAPNSPENGKD